MAATLSAPAPVRRRRGPSEPRAVTGAAVRMPKNKAAVRKAFRKPAEWQEDTWDYFDVVPEVKHLVWWVSNLLSLCDLFPAVELPDGTVVPVDAIDPDTVPRNEQGDPVPGGQGTRYSARLMPDGQPLVSDALAARCVAEWARLGSGSGSIGELQRNLAANLEVAAECYLIGRAARPERLPGTNGPRDPGEMATPERWEIRSISEVYEADGTWMVRDEPGADGWKLDPELDTMPIRLYQQHPRFKRLADCNLRGTIEELRLLQVLNGQMYSEHASKASAGGFTWPAGLTVRKHKPGPAPDEGPEPESGDELTEGEMSDLVDALTNPGHDPTDINSQVPFFVVGEKELLTPDVLRRLDFSRHTGEELDKRIEGRVERFAHGVAAPVEVILGHKNTTFANASQIDENEFDDYLQPRVVLSCDVLTEGFLHPQIAAPPAPVPGSPRQEGSQFSAAEIDRVFVWYDPSPIIGTPSLPEAANDALDRFAVGREGYRRMRGIPEEYAPDEDEVLQMFGLRRGFADAGITGVILEMLNPSFKRQAPLAPAPAAGGELPAGGEPEAGVALAASAALREFAIRQRMLAELGAEVLGLNPATLPALGMGAPPGPPPPRRD